MKKTVQVVIFILLVIIFSMACSNKQERLANARKLLNERCSKCHFEDRIYKKKYTKEDWENIVNRMVRYSKENPQKEKIEIPHEDAYEILMLLQEESGD